MEINELMTWVKNNLLILLTAIGIIIGILALLFGKGVIIERRRRKLDHSKELRDKALSPWLSFLKGASEPESIYFPAGAVKIHDSKLECLVEDDDKISIEMFRPKSNPELFNTPEFKALQQHLEKYKHPTEHKNLKEQYSAIQDNTEKFLRNTKTVIENIESQLFNQLNLPPWDVKGSKPNTFMIPKRLARNIYGAIRWFVDTGRKSDVNLTTPPNEPYEIWWNGAELIFRDPNPQNRRREKEVIYGFLSNERIISMVKKLTRNEKQIDLSIETLIKQLEEIKAKIDSGTPLKGKCNLCPK